MLLEIEWFYLSILPFFSYSLYETWWCLFLCLLFNYFLNSMFPRSFESLETYYLLYIYSTEKKMIFYTAFPISASHKFLLSLFLNESFHIFSAALILRGYKGFLFIVLFSFFSFLLYLFTSALVFTSFSLGLLY